MYFILRFTFVFVAALGLSLVAVSGTTFCCAQASHCSDFPCCGARALGTPLSAAECGLSSCGAQALLGPGIEPMSAHWQADSHPLYHQASPMNGFYSWFVWVRIQIRVSCCIWLIYFLSLLIHQHSLSSFCFPSYHLSMKHGHLFCRIFCVVLLYLGVRKNYFSFL